MIQSIYSFLWGKKYMLLFVAIFAMLLTQRFLNPTQLESGLTSSVASDGTGYYAYLPAAIIYQDFNYDFYGKKENRIKSNYYLAPTKYKDGHFLNKYYCGTSICLLPFFLIAIIISAIADTDINGYTDTFLMLVSIASIIYYLIATFLLTRIARFFGSSEKTAFLISLIFFFGTNLFHYVVQEPSMSHSYSFFAVTLFFYLLTVTIKNTTTKNIAYLALSLSLVALIRPPNIIIILFIPFFFDSIKNCGLFFKALFTKHLLKTSVAILIFALALFLQLTFYYLQTGDFIVESYPGETFNFLKPEIFNILFSYKKGLFLYTPIILVFLLFIAIGKKEWYKRIVFIFTFSVFTYIAASWWCWYYGGGFSGRTFIDIYPLFAITLIVLIEKLSVKKQQALLLLTLPFLCVNQLMAYQYSHQILKSYEMTKERYQAVFLKPTSYSAGISFKTDLLKTRKTIKTYTETFENSEPSEFIEHKGYLSLQSYIFGDKFADSKSLKITAAEINIDLNKPFYIISECDMKSDNKDNDKIATLITSINNGTDITKWDFILETQFDEDAIGWKKMINVIEVTQNELPKNGSIVTYIHKDKGHNLVDNLKYTIIQ